MPVYDRRCATCGWERDDCFEHANHTRVLCPNGHETERAWKMNMSRVAIIGDEFPGGGSRTFENLGHEPVTVHSRSELRREMAARGLEPMVRHVGENHTDKSKKTSRWI